MIHYALSCEHRHDFTGWFRSAEDFDRQQATGLVSCPTCGSTSVEKALMAPAVVTARKRAARPGAETAEAPESLPVPVAMVPEPVLIPPEAREMIDRLRELKAKLLEHSENVGSRFADEARRIHHGEAPERAVHGQATAEQAMELVEEGIDILPLPILPDERN